MRTAVERSLVHAPSGRPRRQYALELARTPSVLGSAAVVLTLSAVLGGVAGVSLVALLVATTWFAAAHPALQRRLDRARAREALRHHRDRRETRLEDADLSRETLSELTELADRIAATGTASLVELEEMLDRYVDLSIASIELGAWLARMSLTDVPRTDASIRSALVRRRNAHIERCRERRDELDRECAAIEERIRTLAQYIRAT